MCLIGPDEALFRAHAVYECSRILKGRRSASVRNLINDSKTNVNGDDHLLSGGVRHYPYESSRKTACFEPGILRTMKLVSTRQIIEQVRDALINEDEQMNGPMPARWISAKMLGKVSQVPYSIASLSNDTRCGVTDAVLLHCLHQKPSRNDERGVAVQAAHHLKRYAWQQLFGSRNHTFGFDAALSGYDTLPQR